MKMLTLLFLAAWAFAGATGLALGDTDEVEYYALLIDGNKIGHMAVTRAVADEAVTTSENMTMTIARGPESMTIHIFSRHLETADGRPVAFEVEQNIGGVWQKTRGRIVDGHAEVSIEGVTGSRKQTIAWPEGALMAEGLRLLQVDKGLEAGTKYEATVFEPSMLIGMKGTVEVGDTADADLFGRVVKLTQVNVTLDMPTGAITSTHYVNPAFRAMRTLVPVMRMNMEMVACSKEFALSDNDVVDFLKKLFVDSPMELKDLRSKKAAQYTLVPANGARLTLPTDDSQTVKSGLGGRLIVEVEPAAWSSGAALPYSGTDPNILQALRPTHYVESDDEKVMELARAAVGDTTDAAEAVRKIESFVAGYIKTKDLSVGYASAAEVALSRQGDCTEHAVLAAAMCRAAGIPARVAFGLVYVEEFMGHKNVFGGHAWTQAYLGDKWVGIDATRVPGGYGAGHILLGTGNGDAADFLAMVNTLGYFKIERVVLK